MSFDAGSIIGEVDLDRGPFNAGLDQAKADAESFEARTWRTALGADTTDLDAKFDDEKAKLDEWGGRTATATLDIDTGDDAEKVAALNAALDAFSKRRDVTKPEVDSSGADRGLDDIKSKAADAAGSDGLGLLMTTALSLGPALIPVGAELVAGLAAIAPMALAAGAGIGAFALAGAGDLGSVEKAAEATLKQFQNLNAPTVLPVIGQSIGLIVPAFAALVPLVNSTAGELSHLETAASDAFKSPFWNGFIAFLAVQAPPAINAFTGLVGGLVKSFAGISEAFGPVISDVEGGMDGFSARIASWGQNLGTSSGFATFLQYVQTEGPVVGNTLTTIGGSLEHILVGLAPIGAVVLGAADSLSKLLDVLTGINPNLTTLLITVGGLAFAYTKLKGPVSDASSAMSTFFKSIQEDTATGLTGEISGLVASFGGLGVVLAGLGAGIGAAGLGYLIGSFIVAKENTDQLDTSVSRLTDGVLQLPTKSLPQATTALSAMQAQLASLDAQTKTTTGTIVNLGTAGPDGMLTGVSASSAAIAALTLDIAGLHERITTANDDLGFLQQRFGISRQSALDLANSLGINLDKSLDPTQLNEFAAGLAQQAANADLTTSALKRVADAAGVSASTMSSALKGAATATQTSWATLGNAVTNFASATLPPTASAIAQFYSQSELQGAQFSQNIQSAIKAGYSPTLISSIIQAGPAQASQLLQGLVNAQGTGLQNLISQATQAMSKEGAEAVEEARLTEVAVTAHSSTIAAALPTALAISQALTATNAAAQLNAVAGTLSGGLPEVLSIAKEFGIAIPNGLTNAVSYAASGGTAQVQAVATAISANAAAVSDAAISTAHIFPAAVSAAAPDAETAAGSQVRSFISGYDSGAGSINSTISAIMNGALVTAGGINWSGVGFDADTGIAAGLNSGVSVVTTAAGQVMKQGLQAARATVQATSPSKVFADQVGLPMAQGVAVGLYAGSGLITTALQAILGDAVNSGQTQAAGWLGGGLSNWYAGGGYGGGILPGRTWNGGGGSTAPTATVVPQPDPLTQIAALAGSYAQAHSQVTFTSSPVISISIPPGSSAELGSIIAQQVQQALDSHDQSMLSALAAL